MGTQLNVIYTRISSFALENYNPSNYENPSKYTYNYGSTLEIINNKVDLMIMTKAVTYAMHIFV